ncbi:PREDICTED: EF-hand calcium-binding domain-containing protein 1-like [Capra hircus]|uniref:EF-hand calcium-binding domain-containing protein 1-like n=1 Tax=Capra hircus TaxID=9925 RepID=UPI0008475575|nr:PREDICTED: EF-hand calcium-binding domain-containing protein 1-like [Capra hircus]
MVTLCWCGVASCGINGNSGRPGLEVGCLRSLHCFEATLDMDQKVLKRLVESISKSVNCKHFNKYEIQCLIRIFHNVVGRGDMKLANAGLDRNTFRVILHSIFGMTDDVLMNRVFFAFDKDNDNYINVKEWVKGLSVFLRGTFEEKLKFCFEVYYFNGDGYISRERIYDMLKNSLHQQSPEEEADEGIRELVDIALKKMDYDNDGRISFADFEKAVKEDRLLLEVFGPCLPDAKSCLDFEALAFQHTLTSSF